MDDVDQDHPLRAGVTVIVTRHLGPYKAFLRGELDLADAADRSAALDRLPAQVEDEQVHDGPALPRQD